MEWGADSYSRLYYRSREHQETQLRAALNAAGPIEGKSVCDVGCGYGDLLRFLPPCRYLGVDVNEEFIDAAREQWPDRWFKVSEKPHLSDVVFSIGVLQMCPDPAKSLDLWLSKARETLVVSTCLSSFLSDERREVIDPLLDEYEAAADDEWDFRIFTIRP